jgi:hypothetical protein
MPFVILLDHIANFPAEQFVDAIEAAGHKGIKAEKLKS